MTRPAEQPTALSTGEVRGRGAIGESRDAEALRLMELAFRGELEDSDCIRLMDLLKLQLEYYLEVHEIAAQGKWRGAGNVLGYVRASVEYKIRLGGPKIHAGVFLFTGAERRKVAPKRGDSEAPSIAAQAASAAREAENYPDLRSASGRQVPWHLRSLDPSSNDQFEWYLVAGLVAELARLKAWMLEPLADALEAKASGKSRDTFLRASRDERERKNRQRVWEWIKDHQKSVIAPVLRGEFPQCRPEPKAEKQPPKAQSLPPWLALEGAISRQRAASIPIPYDVRRAISLRQPVSDSGRQSGPRETETSKPRTSSL